MVQGVRNEVYLRVIVEIIPEGDLATLDAKLSRLPHLAECIIALQYFCDCARHKLTSATERSNLLR